MIKTLRPDGKPGVQMKTDVYNAMQNFFVAALQEEKEVTLPDLISLATQKLPTTISRDIGYLMLQIKLDLEAREVIKQSPSSNIGKGLPTISLKSKKTRTVLVSDVLYNTEKNNHKNSEQVFIL
jgi:hypothetical protein